MPGRSRISDNGRLPAPRGFVLFTVDGINSQGVLDLLCVQCAEGLNVRIGSQYLFQ